jgi:uncharacterized membrane protein YdjX (TVP38/TMEM64 family)
MLVLTCFFLSEAPKLALIFIFLTFAALGVTIASIDAKKHETLFKIFFVTLITATVVLVVYIALDSSGALESLNNVNKMISLIRSAGALGIAVFILLVIVNIVFLPIPSAVLAVIGTILYGPLWSFIYMSVGTVIGSIITFAAGRLFGRKVVVWMIGKEKTDKYSEFIDKKGRIALVFMMIFPFFPDDVLCLIAGMSHMSYGYFLSVVCTTRIAVLAFMCFFADGKIIPFSGWGIPVWIAIGVVLIAAFIAITIVKKKIMKKRNPESVSVSACSDKKSKDKKDVIKNSKKNRSASS